MPLQSGMKGTARREPLISWFPSFSKRNPTNDEMNDQRRWQVSRN
jgi:hypothetical protein